VTSCAKLVERPRRRRLTRVVTRSRAGANGDSGAVLDLPMYQIDALVRRAPSLQKTREGRTPAATY